MSANWVPLIPPSHKTSEDVWQSIYAILKDVTEQQYPPNTLPWTHAPYEDAILFAYMALATCGDAWWRRCVDRLNCAIQQMLGEFAAFRLFGGLCGLGWTVEHISQMKPEFVTPQAAESTDEDVNEEVDAAVLRRLLLLSGRVCDFDLINGLVGYGVYFLERWPSGRSEEGLRAVINALNRIAEKTFSTCTWRTVPERVPAHERELCPNGYYNLGVAHGVPGVLQFLCQIVRTGAETQLVSCLRDGTLGWLTAQAGADHGRLRFKAWVNSEGKSADARPVWCYGDLGVAAILLQVADVTNDDALNKFVLEVLETCLKLPNESYSVQDAGLCHGAIGIAHIYNRIYQRLGDERFRGAALNWYQRALKMFKPGTGVGGYTKYATSGPGGAVVWEAWPGLLDGSIGIALALLAAVTSVEPCWDRLFLLSSRLIETNGKGADLHLA